MRQVIVAIDARSVGQNHTGDSTYWTCLVRALGRLDTDLHFLLFSNVPKPDSIPESGKTSWVQVQSHSNRWWSLFRFPLVARRMGARVLHTQYNLSPLITHGGVTTIHDVSFFHEPEWFQPRDRVLLQRFVPPSARRAERVLTVSEFSKGEIHRYIPNLGDKIVVGPNACDDAIQPMARADARERVRDVLGLEEPYVLTVGTRWPRKNLGLAMRAADALPDSLPHRLVVTGKAGWGDETPGPRTLVTGYVETDLLCALYSGAEAYLAPAHYEGFGITLLEAFRCGCPAIAKANGAHEEVAGDAALILEDDPSQWAAGIQRVANDPVLRNRMVQQGHEREQQFTWDRTATIVASTYREVAASRGHNRA